MAGADLQQGSIVWAAVSDPNGNVKRRPLVIVTSSSEIILDEPIVASPLTTSFPSPAPRNYVEVPWDPRGHPSTRLRRRSAVVCDWGPIELRPSDIESIEGFVPTKYLTVILKRISECRQNP